MNTAFKRLVWKEYRAQRTLWLLLLFAAVAICAAIRVTGAHWTAFVAVAFVVVNCFIVAQFSIAFAGEVDDGTAGFLRMLPCRTKTLGLAKLSAVIAGSVLLIVAIISLSAIIEVTAQALPWVFEVSRHGTAVSLEDPLPPVLGIWILCCAAVFGSLISRKVISAVGVAFVLVLSSAVIAALISDGSTRNVFLAFVSTSSVSVALLAVSVFMLMPQWHLGRLPWSGTVPLAVRDSADRRLPSFTRLWHAWLAKLASEPMSQRRVFSMLLWRECRSAIPFAITWMSIGIALVCGQLFFTATPLTVLFMLIFIHECGQRTMREDQRSGSITLLANIGVSAKQVWWSKIGCWLSVAILGTVCLIAADYLLPWRYLDQPSLLRDLARIHVPTNYAIQVMNAETITPGLVASTQDRWFQAGVCLSIILGLFSIGQLTATWIQRQVLAFAASFVLIMCAGFIVIPRIGLDDWPIWIAIVPIPFCLLAATATTARRWIDRTVTWSLRIQQTAWLFIAIVVIPTLGWFAWFVQPAMALAEFNRQHGDQTSNQLIFGNPAFERRVQLTSQFERPSQLLNQLNYASTPVSMWSEHDEAAKANCWHDFMVALGRLPTPGLLTYEDQSASRFSLWPMFLSYSQQPDIRREELQDLLMPFQAALERDGTFPLLPIAWTTPWSETPAAHITAVLLEDARYREADGDVSGAVQQMVRAIKLCRSLSLQTASWQTWRACLDAERVALGRLRLLLGTADLSSLDLESLFVVLKEELIVGEYSGHWMTQCLDIRPMLRRRRAFYTAASVNPVEYFSAIKRRPSFAQYFGTSGNVMEEEYTKLRDLSSSRRVRTIEIMKFSESLLVDRYQSQSVYGKFEFSASPRPEQVYQLARFLATSVIADLETDFIALSSHERFLGFEIFQIDTIASERATLLTIKLQQYRLEHSEFPESLMDLLDDDRMNSQMFPNPYSGAPFFYTPRVVDKPVRIDMIRVWHKPEIGVTGGRILACIGPTYSNHDSVFRHTWDEETAVYLQLPPNLILFVGLGDPLDWRLKQIATPVTPTIQSPDGIPQEATDPPAQQPQD